MCTVELCADRARTLVVHQRSRHPDEILAVLGKQGCDRTGVCGEPVDLGEIKVHGFAAEGQVRHQLAGDLETCRVEGEPAFGQSPCKDFYRFIQPGLQVPIDSIHHGDDQRCLVRHFIVGTALDGARQNPAQDQDEQPESRADCQKNRQRKFGHDPQAGKRVRSLNGHFAVLNLSTGGS